jgi:ferredoxin-type protein NapH
LLGFLAAALITHLLLPLIVGTWEVYSVSMPLPWSTAGLQLQSLGENFGRSFVGAYGETTLAMILLAFWGYNLVIGIGSILFGRRLQCSQLCLLHGFMAETMDPALPLVGKKTGLNTFARSKGGKGLFLILRTTFYLVALVLTIFWTITVFNPTFFTSEQLDSWRSIEVVKYMGIDLLSMLTFWVIIGPRAYCQYCPAGTTVGLIARHLGRQQIETNLTHCTNCGACTKLCPMGLDPQSAALAKTPFTSSACVGCGRCVESCPTENLKYSTAFQRYLFNQNTRQ